MGLRNSPADDQSDAGAVWFGREEWNEQILCARQSGPSILNPNHREALF